MSSQRRLGRSRVTFRLRVRALGQNATYLAQLSQLDLEPQSHAVFAQGT